MFSRPTHCPICHETISVTGSDQSYDCNEIDHRFDITSKQWKLLIDFEAIESLVTNDNVLCISSNDDSPKFTQDVTNYSIDDIMVVLRAYQKSLLFR